MHAIGTGGRKVLALKVAVVMVVLLFTATPVFSKGVNPHRQHNKYDPVIMQSAVVACFTVGSDVSCHGGYNSTSSFASAVTAGDVVTVSMTYVDYGVASPTVSFSDNHDDSITMVVHACAPTTPIICSAIGYFVPAVTSLDMITVTVQGGTSGRIDFSVLDWFANNSLNLKSVGTSGYCTACTSPLSLTPITFGTLPNETIAVSQVQAFFAADPTSWSPSLPYFYSYYESAAVGSLGMGSMWQATDGVSASYSFVTNVSGSVPVAFCGTAIVLYV